MALIGLKMACAAIPAEYVPGELPNISNGFIVGRAITADKDIKFAENPLYADDTTVENESIFESGTMSLGIDDILLPVQAKLFGHDYKKDSEITDAQGAAEELVKGGLDQAPYVVFGYYKTRIYRRVRSYEVTILYKVKFAPPKESAKTKEKGITWGTKQTDGTVECLEGFEKDIYERVLTFKKESEAKDFMRKYFDIKDAATSGSLGTEPSSGSDTGGSGSETV